MEVAGTVGFCAGPPPERRGRFAACTATMLGTLLLSELWAPMTIGSLVASFLKTLTHRRPRTSAPGLPRPQIQGPECPPFYENLVSSVRPSEAKTGKCLCVHTHSGGVVGFSIIGFSSMTPPRGASGPTVDGII